MKTPLLEGIAKALCKAYGNEWDESPETGSGYASGDPRLPAKADWRKMAVAAMEVMKAPLLAIESAKACTLAAAKLSEALDAEGDHTPDVGAECEVCAALGELHAAFDAMAGDTKAMQEARAKLEKEAKQ